MKFVTYVISDPKTGVARYVGKGYEKRPFAHLNKSSNPQLHNLIQKRKREGFQISPFIIKAESDSDAIEMEILLIKLIGREDKQEGTLFNHTDGGDGTSGKIVSDVTRLKLSESLKGKPSHSKGKPRISPNEETRAKLKLSRQHRVTKEETRQKMSVKRGKPCTVDGITIFPSQRALKAALGKGVKGVKSPNFRYVE